MKFLPRNTISQIRNTISYLRWWRKLTGTNRIFAQILTICFVIFLGLLVVTELILPKKASGAWFNENWAYRKAINISAHTAAEKNVYIKTGAGGISFIKQTTGQTPDGTSASYSFPVTSTTGDTLILFTSVSGGSTRSISSITDSAGNTWVVPSGNSSQNPPANFLTGSNSFFAMAYALNANAVTSITVTYNAADDFSVNVAEFSGIANSSAIDQSASSGNAANTSQTTSTINTTNASDLIIGGLSVPTTTRSLTTANFNALTDWSDVSGNGNGSAAYRIVSSTGSYSIGWNLGASEGGGTGIMAFKSSGNSGVTLDTSDTSKFQSDCGDLRFTDASGNLLPYYIVSGCGTSNTIVHIFMKDFPAGAQTLYMYYGNPSANNGFSTSDFATEASSYTIGSLGSEENGPAPLGYWSLDEGQGNVASSSATTALPMKFYNNPTWLPESQCVSGKCMQFDGVDDFGSVDDTTQTYSNSFTAGVWLKSNSWVSTNNKYIVSKREASLTNEWAISVTTSGNVEFLVWNAPSTLAVDLVSNKTLDLNKWYHVVVSTDGSTPKIYINGVLDTSGSQTLTMANTSSHIILGRCSQLGTCNNENTRQFQGVLDELKIYNTNLSAAQVQAWYNARGSTQGAGGVLGAKDQSYLTNGLVGYWKMDETTSGTCSGGVKSTCDSSGNGNDGTWTSATASTSAKFGSGVTFNGSSSYVGISHSNLYDFSSDFTVSTWVKFKVIPSSSDVKLIYNNKTTSPFETFELSFDSGNGFVFQVPNTNATYTYAYSYPASQFSANTWYLVTGVKSGNLVKLYVNGVLMDTETFSGTLATTTSSLYFGGIPTQEILNGVMDDVRLYGRSFSDTEVQQLYNYAPGPVGYWDFEEHKGTVVTDRSGNGNNGSFTSTPVWTTGKYGGGLRFNGSNNGATVTDNSKYDSIQYTVGFWVKGDQAGGVSSSIQQPVAKQTSGDGTTFQFNWQHTSATYAKGCSHSIGSATYTGAAKLTSTLGANTWYYITCTYDGSNIKAYLNGRLEGTYSVGVPETGSGPLNIGIGNLSHFAGVIDELRVYNYPRTSKQIVEDMNASHPAGGSPVGSMLGWWKFDAGMGNVASNSGSMGHNLDAGMYNFSSPASQTSGWSSDGKFGKALNFDGTDDIVEVANNSAMDNMSAFSVSAWINPRSLGQSSVGRIVTKVTNSSPTNGWMFSVGTGNSLTFVVDYSGTNLTCVSASNVFNLKTWTHVLISWDGTSTASHVHFYVNGSNVGCSTSIDGTGSRVSDAGESIRIGNIKTRTNTFDGLIDEVKVYNYDLSPSDARIDYNRGSSLKFGVLGTDIDGVTASDSAERSYCPPGDTSTSCSPVIYWPMESKTGSIVSDASGHGLDGTITSRGSFVRGKIGEGVSGPDSTAGGTGPISAYSSVFPSLKSTAGSWAVWFYPTATPTDSNNGNGIIAFQDGTNSLNDEVFLGYTTSRALLLRHRVGTETPAPYHITCTTAANIIGLNQWSHLEVVQNGTSPVIYINGILTPWTCSGSALGSWTSALSGNYRYEALSKTGSESPGGIVDEVKIYNYARSASQVAWDYNTGKPVVWYKLDECQGSTLHSSIGTMSATLTLGASGTQGSTAIGTCSTASTAWGSGATGKYNYSVNFDGTDDFASSALIPQLEGGSNVSLSAWVKSPSWNGHNFVAGLFGSTSDKGYWIDVDSAGTAAFWVSEDGSAQTAASTYPLLSLQTGQWYHIVGTYKSGSVKIYVNGTYIQGATTGGSTLHWVTTANSFAIGRLGATSSDYFNGQIDDVQMYNYALTPAQVRTLYNQNSAVRFGPATGAP